MRNSFVFYKSFAKSAQNLKNSDRLRLYDAIILYALDDVEPNLTGNAKALFTLIQPQLDANNKRYENGKKGGRPLTKTKPNDNQTETKPKPNVNVNVNVNDNVNVSGYKPDVPAATLLIISRLNELTGRRYKSEAPENLELVGTLLDRGYTVEDIIRVVNRKSAEWLGSEKMRPYLRPSTLFNPEKFDEYLNAPETSAELQATETKNRKEQAAADIECYVAELDELQQRYDAASDFQTRFDIKGRRAVIEAKLEAARAVVG